MDIEASLCEGLPENRGKGVRLPEDKRKDAEDGGRDRMSILVEDYGVTKDGEQVRQYIMENAGGMKAVLLNYGAVLAKLYVPDKDGKLRDVVWGYENLAGYEKNGPCLGATVGRNANRIGGASVTIAGKVYELEKNDGENSLHSGSNAYFRRMWKAVIADDNKVEFSLHSPDGDQGFPGNADITVSYTLSDDNELLISYEGKADQDTIFNLTNHSYFNLDGQESDSVLAQKAWLDADAFTPSVDMIPTGEIRSVEGTPMDFRTPTALGERIDADYEPLRAASGYDHNYVMKREGEFTLCGSLYSEDSGIRMEVYTDAPGIQLYTANFLGDEPGGKGGRVYSSRSAVCFEAQYFPDANHHENFKNSVVKAGDVYRSRTGYKFSAEKA